MRTPPINSWHPDARLPEDADRMEWLLRRARRELLNLRAAPPSIDGLSRIHAERAGRIRMRAQP